MAIFSVSYHMAKVLREFPRVSFVCLCTQLLQSCLTPCDPMDLNLLIHCAWNFPAKNTEVGCYALLQGIFLTQGLNLHLLYLLHCRQILHLLNHWGSLSSHTLVFRVQISTHEFWRLQTFSP